MKKGERVNNRSQEFVLGERRRKSHRNASGLETKKKKTTNKSDKLTLTLKHRGFRDAENLQKNKTKNKHFCIPGRMRKTLGQTKPSVLSHVVKGTAIRHIDKTGPPSPGHFYSPNGSD